jgi:hypothetical protein
MRRQSVLNGVNVPIEPSNNTANTITNHITIGSPGTRVKYSIESPESNVSINPTNADSNVSLEQYLLNLYSSILLTEDIKLIANIISDNKIILAKSDLEEVVFHKIHKKCVISLDDADVSCCGKPVKSPFAKINTIRITEDENIHPVDFKYIYNKDYIDLENNYHISLNRCLNI